MWGFISGISDTDDIYYCPKCGEELYSYHGDGTATCDECGYRFGVVEWRRTDMQELKKLLEEIDFKITRSMGRKREGLLKARDIIRKHMNDGWIPVEERLPKVAGDIDDDNCPEFNVTIDGADKATTLKCSSDGTFFDDNGYVYPVIAWRPLPEPYKPKQPETRKYTICSCCWSIDQCSDCPNNPERSENDQ